MHTNKAEDILIVGAGPAGAASSMWLSANHIPHTILDKAVFPRDKVCGDAVTGKVISILKQLEPDIAQQMAALSHNTTITSGVLFSAPNGKEFTIDYNGYVKNTKDRSPNPTPGFVVKREFFDNFLFEKINPAYADIRQNTSLLNIAYQGNGELLANIEQDGNAKELRPKVVIGSDGDRSVVNRQLAKYKNGDENYAAAVRGYYSNVTGFNELNAIELHFIKESLPGYLWLFPLPDGGCNAGMGILSSHLKKTKRNLRKEMAEILLSNPKFKDRFANAKLESKIVGWGLPLGSKKRKISGERYILTGDAASLIDPLSGEGIGNAVISGKYAALAAIEAIKRNDFSESFFHEHYDSIIYSKLWKEFRFSHMVQKMSQYPVMLNIGIDLVARSTYLQDALSMIFVDPDFKKQFKNPLFYLKMMLSK